MSCFSIGDCSSFFNLHSSRACLRGRHVDFEFYSLSLGIRGQGSLEIGPDGDRIALKVVNPINGQRVTSDLQRAN
jgi:hypothetical protein